MTVEAFTTPAGPVADNEEMYGGYAYIARALSEKEPERKRPYSRQLVEKWYKHRVDNDFPEPVRTILMKSGRTRKVFSITEVEQWLKGYRVKPRTRKVSGNEPVPHMGTLPMFPIGRDGSPLC